MRQFVLFFLCAITNFVMAQEKIEYRYWFDNSNETIKTGLSDKNDFHLDIDASKLKTGLHSFNYQILDGGKGESSVMSSLFYKSSSFLNKKSIVSIDGKVIKDYSAFTDNPSIIKIDLDAQTLDLGVHTLSVQVVDDSGVSSSNIEAFFTKVPTQGDIQSMNLYYMIDNNIGKKQPCTFTNSLASAEIDASSLSDGLHSITFFMYNPEGLATQAKSTFFIKEPLGGNGIKAYKYWLNEDVEHCQENEFDPTKAEVKIVGLFDMEHPELRSSNFHFAIENDKAVLYPKNTFNLRVNDVSGRITSSKSDYIDVTKRELLDMNSIVPIASGQSYDNSVSDKNGISWFQFTGKDGDSISIRANRACMLEVYSPSGKILHQTDGYDATTANGMFLEEDGTYYVALHDVRTSAKDVNLDFYQIAKYAVVSYDVHRVGNGGVSSIIFKGNGYFSLNSIDISNGKKDIPCMKIERKSNNLCEGIFDFSNVPIGEYSISFNFIDEKIVIANGVTVEKPKEIQIKTNVEYSPTYLKGTTQTYSIKITNKSNQTAYNVPIYSYLSSKSLNGISYIKFRGLNLPSYMDEIDTQNMDVIEVAKIKGIVNELGDTQYFRVYRTFDENTKDSVYVWSGYVFCSLQPYETKNINVDVISSEKFDAWFTIPEDGVILQTNSGNSKKNVQQRNNIKDNYCCVKDNIECIVSYFVDVADLASILSAAFVIAAPEAGVSELLAVVTPIVDCVANILSTSYSTFNTALCEGQVLPEDYFPRLDRKIAIGSTLLSCAGAYISKLKDVGALIKGINIAVTLGSAGTLGAGIHITKDCTEQMLSHKPGCPPVPPSGGTSTPVIPVDPNDILGYVAQSGSHYVGLNQKKLGYTIEFENDSTKATASAHEIVIKDKLDANIFNINSIHTSKIVIGKHEIDIDADGEFVKTIDMRPAINALAEVKLNISSNGEVVYSITSLDPMTAESTTDMMAGILPINNANKDGEGYIVFDVKLKDGLADGTKIDNAASIIFDANDAISTPVWSNETDYVMPVGYVDGIKQVDANHIKIEMDGIDERSGIWKYDLYYQAGVGSSWFPLTEDLTANTYEMEVYDDIDYGFCVVATDKAGNKEVKELSRDYSYLNGVITSGIEKVETNNTNLKGRLYDLSGRRVKGKPSKGIYIVKGRKILCL